MPTAELNRPAELNRLVARSAFRYRPISTTEVDMQMIPTWKVGRKTFTRSQKQLFPSSLQSRKMNCPAQRQTFSNLHWTVPVGLTMTAMLLLALIIQFAWAWGTSLYNDLHFGMPRTMQVDAFVGHESGGKVPSHFLAENLHGQVLIIEFPGGDVRHARVFVGPQITGADADQVPVRLSFLARNGGHASPDMMVQFGDMAIWYKNDHGTFLPQ